MKKVVQIICGFFDSLDTVYVRGKYSINIVDRVFELESVECITFSEHSFDVFNLKAHYEKLYEIIEREETFIQGISSFSASYERVESILDEYTNDVNLKKQIKHLGERQTRVTVTIQHRINPKISANDGIDYLTKVFQEYEIEKSKLDFLEVLREFQNYHEITRAPYIFQNNLHFRDTSGIISFFDINDGETVTTPKSIHSWYTPKFESDDNNKALEFFKAGHRIKTENLLMARAEIYVHQHNYSLAVIHAVMSIECIVPPYIHMYLSSKGVGASGIRDFSQKFGISVRVKTILKVIMTRDKHTTIDGVSELISIRNKIIHEGLDDLKLRDMDIKSMIKCAARLKQIIQNNEC